MKKKCCDENKTKKKVQRKKGMVIFKLTPEQKELAIKILEKRNLRESLGKTVKDQDDTAF